MVIIVWTLSLCLTWMDSASQFSGTNSDRFWTLESRVFGKNLWWPWSLQWVESQLQWALEQSRFLKHRYNFAILDLNYLPTVSITGIYFQLIDFLWDILNNIVASIEAGIDGRRVIKDCPSTSGHAPKAVGTRYAQHHRLLIIHSSYMICRIVTEICTENGNDLPYCMHFCNCSKLQSLIAW